MKLGDIVFVKNDRQALMSIESFQIATERITDMHVLCAICVPADPTIRQILGERGRIWIDIASLYKAPGWMI